MVTLSKIYTRAGDKGQTMLGDGSMVDKSSLRVRAFGTVDELNSILGLVLLAPLDAALQKDLRKVQNDLFDVGSDLCTPYSEKELAGEEQRGNRLPSGRDKALEDIIDGLQKDLEPLKSFVLPGGSPASAWLHMARVVCRRAEIEALALAAEEKVNQAALIYLNRLSDLFFVMARWENRSCGEVLWVPGGTKE